MKKLPKLLLALLLVLSLSLSLCACKDCETHVDADKDGKCDECEAPVETKPECTHSDKNDDGKCDDCTVDFTDGCDNHVDADDNGKCDVAGCTADFTDGCDNHVDANDDGVCDVTDCDEACIDGCDNHVDLDDNGVCDVTGCDEAYTDGCNNHTDADLDHVCDSTDCSVVIGTCGDADHDHDCDYGCDKVWGDHADADLDHDCDYGCNVAIGDHADADLDHECDYGCSVAIGTCGDEDYDHECDYGCDKTFGTEEDKDDDLDCDYCGEAYTDGCDTKDCLDTDNDGFCDNDGCDKATENKPVPGSSFNTAIELVEDDDNLSTSAKNGQKVYYKLTASTTGNYDIGVWGSFIHIDVYAEDNTTVAVDDWDIESSYLETLHTVEVEFEEGSTYYIVLTYNGSADATIYLTAYLPEAESEEPVADGTSFESAITLEDRVAVTGTATYSKNTLYYRLNVTTTGEYRIVVDGASYYILTLYSADNTGEAIKTWDKSGAYNGNIEEFVDLVSGKTYYFVFEDNYGYGYKLTVSYRPECTAHADANDDAKCDVCDDAYTDGCDQKECLDLTNDGLCDNVNCDNETDNSAEGSTFDKALNITLDTAADVNILVSGHKTYFKFTATSDWHNVAIASGYYSTIQIYDAENTAVPLRSSTGSYSSANHTLLFKVTTGNEYYLVIGSTQNEYTYAVTLSEAADPFDSSTELVPGETTQNITFGANQTLYFIYTAAQTGDYRLMTDSSYNWANNEVTIYDSNKAIIAGPILSTSYKVDTTVAMTAGETYYITITYLGTYSTNVKVTFTAPAAGDTEPEEPVADGSSFDKAYTLEEGVKATGAASSNTVYYRFVAATTSAYRIAFYSSNYSLNLYNADDLTAATLIGSTNYLYSPAKYTVDLVEGETYYFVLTPKYSSYAHEITISLKPACSEHIDADDNAACDVCDDSFTDGCDQKECLDVNNDGLCDNTNCDEATENKAAGSSFDNAIDLTLNTATTVTGDLVDQKIYLQFTATTEWYSLAISAYNTKLEIYSAEDTNNHILSTTLSSKFNKALHLEEGGIYYIVLYSSNTYSTVSANITLAETTDPFESATELTASGEAASVAFAPYQTIYFAYTATETGDYHLLTDSYASYYDNEVTVYNADKAVIIETARSSGYSSNYTLDTTIAMTAGETYYFAVTLTGGYSSSYNVEITLTAPAAE